MILWRLITLESIKRFRAAFELTHLVEGAVTLNVLKNELAMACFQRPLLQSAKMTLPLLVA